MRFLAAFFRVLGYLWLAVAGVVIVMGFIGVEIKGGFSAVQKLLSPFNLPNLVVTLITLAPGIGLLIIVDIFRQKIKSKRFF
jgi:uncharacterized membrane protein